MVICRGKLPRSGEPSPAPARSGPSPALLGIRSDEEAILNPGGGKNMRGNPRCGRLRLQIDVGKFHWHMSIQRRNLMATHYTHVART